jgi:hypothetical protein
MVLRVMKSFSRMFFLVVIVICFSCEDKGWFTDCSGCTSNEPKEAILLIKLKDTESQVKINVYEGELEDSVIYGSAVFWGSEYNFTVGLNKEYTLTATYIIGGNTYTAIDSATPKVRFTETQCEEACYFVYDRVVDLRLKYTAKGE